MTLVLLICGAFIVIVGVVTLVSFVAQRRREQRHLLASDVYDPSSPSVWLSDVHSRMSRGGLSSWTATEPHPLDVTSSSSADMRRHDATAAMSDFRRLKDERRRSFHATTSAPAYAEAYPEPIEAYPMHSLRPSPYPDVRGHSHYSSFPRPLFRSGSAVGARLPRYGNSSEFPDGPDLNARLGSGYYMGTCAYP